MKLYILKDAEAAADAAAQLITDRVTTGRAKVLGLSTGKTPIGIYARLSAKVAAGRLSFTEVTSFNLDEYLGLTPDHPASFHVFMQQHLFGSAPFAATHIPDGAATDPDAEAAAYDAKIRDAGGIDLQLLGIGRNGHIAFNEPGSPLDSRTRVVTLAEDTRLSNAPDFPTGEQVPHHALTMGIGTIMDARELLLVATGAAKAEAIKAALTGPISPDCPASVLQNHPNAVIYADEAAASLLTEAQLKALAA